METLREFCESVYNIDWSTYTMYATTLYALRLFITMLVYMIADKFQLMENTILRKTIEFSSNIDKIDNRIDKTILLQIIPIVGGIMFIIDVCIILNDLNERVIKNIINKINK